MVDWKVCRNRGRLKGPGTKSRATGSDEGGDCTGCSGPRLYLGGWYWYLLPGRGRLRSAARFHGRKIFFSSGLSSGASRFDPVSSSSSGTAGASAAWVEAVLRGHVGKAERDNWEKGSPRADLETPRRLAMADGDGDARAVNPENAIESSSGALEIFWVQAHANQD